MDFADKRESSASAAGQKRRRPKLLMSAYACSPGRGSEPGVGWNRALQAARDFDTWVITEDATCGKAIRRYLRKHAAIPGLEFVYIPKSFWVRLLRYRLGLYHAALRLWHLDAYRVARRLHHELRFDLVHQVNFMTYREPGYLWKLGVPFIWGPWGGVQNFPWRFLPLAGFGGALSEGIRSILNYVQLRLSWRVRKATAAAALLLACNSENQRTFAAVHGRTPEILAGNGVPALLGPRPARQQHSTLRLLWVGRLENLKGLPILLRSLTHLPKFLSYELHIVGQGRKKKAWRRMAARLGLSGRVVWVPYLSSKEVQEEYLAADLFIFTSMRETVPTVIIEALTSGLPIIYLDHLGLRDMVPPECGIGVTVRTPRQVTIDLAQAIARLAGDADARERMGAASAVQAQQYLWSRQGEELNRRMLQVLDAPSLTMNRDEGGNRRDAAMPTAALQPPKIRTPHKAHGRIHREQKTISAMIDLYCHKRHSSKPLCPICDELSKYAFKRLEKCPFGEEKTTCVNCIVHCFKSDMRERIREVMRFSGPRMMLRHPILAIAHILDGRMDASRQGRIDAHFRCVSKANDISSIKESS